jgi:hypothetical protein
MEAPIWGVHMYFRTSTDMAPEITRFNGHGLQEGRWELSHVDFVGQELPCDIMISW